MPKISHKHLIDEPSSDIGSVDSIDIGSIDQYHYNKAVYERTFLQIKVIGLLI